MANPPDTRMLLPAKWHLLFATMLNDHFNDHGQQNYCFSVTRRILSLSPPSRMRMVSGNALFQPIG